MAETPDAVDLQRRARRRLVGVIALVVFVVIVLPVVFDREPKPISQDLTIQIPSQDAGRSSSRALPVVDPKPEARTAAGNQSKAEAAKTVPESRVDARAPIPAAPASVSEKADRVADAAKPPAASRGDAAAKPPAPRTEAGKPVVANADVAKADVTKAGAAKAEASKAAAPNSANDATSATAGAGPKPVAENAAARAKPDTAKGASGQSFVVPLGLFRNPDNIKKVRGWVSSAGYESFTEQAPETAVAGKAAALKVLAGPFPTRDAAEKARDKLKAKGVDVGPVAPR